MLSKIASRERYVMAITISWNYMQTSQEWGWWTLHKGIISRLFIFTWQKYVNRHDSEDAQCNNEIITSNTPIIIWHLSWIHLDQGIHNNGNAEEICKGGTCFEKDRRRTEPFHLIYLPKSHLSCSPLWFFKGLSWSPETQGFFSFLWASIICTHCGTEGIRLPGKL